MVAVEPFVSDREHVLITTRAHAWVLAGAALRALGAVALVGAALVLLHSAPDLTALAGATLVAALMVTAVCVARLVQRVWEWDRTVLAVTEEHVLVVRSALRRSTHVVPIAGVQRLRVRQSRLGRHLGFGTVLIEGEARRSRLAYVPHPERVSQVIAEFSAPRAS